MFGNRTATIIVASWLGFLASAAAQEALPERKCGPLKHVGTVENTKTFSVDFENKRVDDLPAKIDERTISFCFPGARSLPESCVNIDRFSGKGSRTSYVGNSEFIYKWNCVKSTRKF